jgi:hypothetical protein
MERFVFENWIGEQMSWCFLMVLDFLDTLLATDQERRDD